MRDMYTESVVPMAPNPAAKTIRIVLLVLLAAAFVLFVVSGIPGLVAMTILGFLLYRHNAQSGGEYEYVHTNDIFDVDFVPQNGKRRQLVTLKLQNVILVAPAHSEEMTALGRMQGMDFSGGAGEESLYAMVYTKDGSQQKLLLRMDEDMRKSLKLWLPGKVR